MPTFLYKLLIINALFASVLNASTIVSAQHSNSNGNCVFIKPAASGSEVLRAASQVRPSQRQLEWQQLETTAFIHFGINTFYNQEWGHGTEDPARFNPACLNTDQWSRTLADAGMKMVILTCKHHDGFCLWPSRYTTHSVAYSPWKQGNGDVVKELAESCRKFGLKFGVYLSPWDRHERTYGDSEAYNVFFLNQLTELLTQYGTIDEVWFDGANGEGPNGKKQVYDWKAYYTLVRKLQPQAVIAVMGPDVRWVGTESGYGRETEWSVVPLEVANADDIAANSQQQDADWGFVPAGDRMQLDLGSREAIKDASALIWYPSEVDVSIRPGWFWHAAEDSLVKTPEKLLDIYFSSVGRNSLLLLNVPPDTAGLINASDCQALSRWRQALDRIFADNLLVKASLTAGINKPDNAVLTDKELTTSASVTGELKPILEFDLGRSRTFDLLLLQENITLGQQIEHFHLEALVNRQWVTVALGTTVGYKRLLRFGPVKSRKVRLVIDQARATPQLAEAGIYFSGKKSPKRTTGVLQP